MSLLSSPLEMKFGLTNPPGAPSAAIACGMFGCGYNDNSARATGSTHDAGIVFVAGSMHPPGMDGDVRNDCGSSVRIPCRINGVGTVDSFVCACVRRVPW